MENFVADRNRKETEEILSLLDLGFDVGVPVIVRKGNHCSVCNIRTNSEQTYIDHMRGKKHRKKLKLILACREMMFRDGKQISLRKCVKMSQSSVTARKKKSVEHAEPHDRQIAQGGGNNLKFGKYNSRKTSRNPCRYFDAKQQSDNGLEQTTSVQEPNDKFFRSTPSRMNTRLRHETIGPSATLCDENLTRGNGENYPVTSFIIDTVGDTSNENNVNHLANTQTTCTINPQGNIGVNIKNSVSVEEPLFPLVKVEKNIDGDMDSELLQIAGNGNGLMPQTQIKSEKMDYTVNAQKPQSQRDVVGFLENNSISLERRLCTVKVERPDEAVVFEEDGDKSKADRPDKCTTSSCGGTVSETVKSVVKKKKSSGLLALVEDCEAGVEKRRVQWRQGRWKCKNWRDAVSVPLSVASLVNESLEGNKSTQKAGIASGEQFLFIYIQCVSL